MTLNDSLQDNKHDAELDKLADEAMDALEKQGGLFGSALKMAGKALNPFSKAVAKEAPKTLAQKALSAGGKVMIGGMAAGAGIEAGKQIHTALKNGARPLEISDPNLDQTPQL